MKVDGFVHGATGYEDWGLQPEDEAIVAWKVKSLREAGTHIMGRLTYEAMAADDSKLISDFANEPLVLGRV